MIQKTSTTGFEQVKSDNAAANTAEIAARIDYVAMMCDIDLPDTVEGVADNEQKL